MAYLTLGQKLKRYSKGSRSFFLSRFFTHRPFLLSHLITTAWNASCSYCYWRYPQKDELSTDEVKKLYDEARREGFFVNAIWGGEPLLRNDLPEVVKYSADLGFLTTVFSNGYYLADRHEFAKYPDTLILSLDDTEDRHDALRGVKGLFKKAIQGIDVVKTKYPHTYITINCTLSKLNIGVAERIIMLGKELNIPVFFGTVCFNECASFPIMPEKPTDLSASRDALSEEFKVVRKYKEQGYRINTSYHFADYFIEKKDYYHCHWPKVCFGVYSNGDVENCLTDGVFDNLRKHPLREVLKSQKFKNSVAKTDGCTLACQGSDPLECSALYSFNWASMKNFIGVYLNVRGYKNALPA